MSGGPSATLDLYTDDPAGAPGGVDPAGGIGKASEDEVVLSGTLSGYAPTGSPGQEGFNTLDEPIKETVLRDVRAVGSKFYHVLYPVAKKRLLRVRNKDCNLFCFLKPL